MRILYLITALGVGGAENLLVDICKHLKNRHEITVVYLMDDKEYEKIIKDMGIETIFIPYEKHGMLGCVKRVRKIIKEKSIDLIHTHLPRADSVGRLAGITLPMVKIVSTIHSNDPWRALSMDPFHSLLRLYDCITINFFPRVHLLTVSNSVKKFVKKHELIFDRKITVMYNFIDMKNPRKEIADFISPIDRSKNFVMIIVARMEKNKQHELLFEAVSRLSKYEKYSHIKLLVMGAGTEEDKLRNYVKDNNLSEHIIFVGRKPNVYNYLKNSDLFVLPSDNEGQSIAVLESFFCRTPVLVSDIDANTELLINESHGVSFKTNDLDDLCKKITNFIEQKYDVDSMIEKAYNFCLGFTCDRYMKSYEEYLKNI